MRFLVFLEKLGIDSMNQLVGVAAANAYMSYISGLSEDKISDEITAHVENGGSFEEIIGFYAEKVDESGFFRAMLGQKDKTAEEEIKATQESAPEKKTKRKVASE